MLQKYVFANASKHWNHYVRKLLHKSLDKHRGIISLLQTDDYSPPAKTNLICLKYLLHRVKLFIDKSKQVNNEQCVRYHNFFRKPLKTYRFNNPRYYKSKSGQYLVFLVHFRLHPNFHLNITAHYIYFSANSFLKCYFGNLVVRNFLRNTKDNGFNFKYCGIVPSFNLYPPSHRLTIEITIVHHIIFDSLITHSVIDSGRITSYQVQSNMLATPSKVLKFVTSDSFFVRYELQVEKYECLFISGTILQNDFIEVYDGPGILYNVLEPYVSNGHLLYTTTTFQSIIYLFTKSQSFSGFVTYEATMPMTLVKQIYMEKNQSILLTSENELDSTPVQLIKIQTYVELFLNITIHQMENIGNNHSSCGYAGITSYDIKTDGTFKKISTICHGNNYEEYKYRNMYTQNSVVLLVLYAYKKYSNFSLVLSVSISYCKATTINICELEHDPVTLESYRFFSVRKHKCIVLQLDYRQANISLFNPRNTYQYGAALPFYSVYSGTNSLRGKL